MEQREIAGEAGGGGGFAVRTAGAPHGRLEGAADPPERPMQATRYTSPVGLSNDGVPENPE